MGALRQELELYVAITLHVIKRFGRADRIVVVGCGAGLVPHPQARQGLACTGVDRDERCIALARLRAIPPYAPTFVHQSHPRRLPLADGQADLALLFGQFERHDNPVVLLRQTRRILAEGKLMAIVSLPHPDRELAPTDPHHFYHPSELFSQVQAVGGWQLLPDHKPQDPKSPTLLLTRQQRSAAATAVDAAAAVTAAPNRQRQCVPRLEPTQGSSA